MIKTAINTSSSAINTALLCVRTSSNKFEVPASGGPYLFLFLYLITAAAASAIAISDKVPGSGTETGGSQLTLQAPANAAEGNTNMAAIATYINFFMFFPFEELPSSTVD